METDRTIEDLRNRRAPLEMSPEEFARVGHALIDRVANLLGTLRDRPVTPAESVTAVRAVLDSARTLPRDGESAGALLDRATGLLEDHSLFNGHPAFYGFITSPSAPIGVLGDLLASTVNANVGGWILSPMASEIEGQTVRWIAEMLGYPTNCGGLLVSGGNMANFVGFLVGRHAKTPWNVRTLGMGGGADAPKPPTLRVYTSAETHTWVEKAADLFGLGTDAIRWIETDSRQRMSMDALRRRIDEDTANGDLPIMVIGTAGSTSTGAIDPLPEIAALCRERGLWFHVDGAYGGFAACLPGAPAEMAALSEADSIAIDPHKWLYAPLEAGCVLVRDKEALRTTFDYHPSYYHILALGEEPPVNYYEYGMQNSRGFRALKVWLALQQVGLEGYRRMIADDIRLTEELFRCAGATPEVEAATCSLSVATFRYVPEDFDQTAPEAAGYLNTLNATVLDRIQACGEAFLSNAVIGGDFYLRACIVNFRTSLEDVRALPTLVVRLGREVDAEMRTAQAQQEAAAPTTTAS